MRALLWFIFLIFIDLLQYIQAVNTAKAGHEHVANPSQHGAGNARCAFSYIGFTHGILQPRIYFLE